MAWPAVVKGTAVLSLQSMMGAKPQEKFGVLEAKGNMILKEYPNHCLVNSNRFSIVVV
jgi:hypothetical protein